MKAYNFFFVIVVKERELEANKKEKVKEAQLEAEVKLLRKENEALRRHIAVLQAEVYGARLAAKYLDKELAGRYVKSVRVPKRETFSVVVFFLCMPRGRSKEKTK